MEFRTEHEALQAYDYFREHPHYFHGDLIKVIYSLYSSTYCSKSCSAGILMEAFYFLSKTALTITISQVRIKAKPIQRSSPTDQSPNSYYYNNSVQVQNNLQFLSNFTKFDPTTPPFLNIINIPLSPRVTLCSLRSCSLSGCHLRGWFLLTWAITRATLTTNKTMTSTTTIGLGRPCARVEPSNSPSDHNCTT